MTGPDFGVDVNAEQANVARIYDYWLGGAHNFAVDRDHGDRIEAANPNARHAARSNRAFLFRVVRLCAARGIDQFLDLGSGVPTVGNVHEVVGEVDPAARVVYVDHEAVAVAHSRQILDGVGRAAVVHADLRDHGAVLGAPQVGALLDPDRPTALLLVAVGHYVPGDLAAILAPYRARLAPGSVVAVSHVTDEVDDPALRERIHAATESFADTASAVVLRSRAEIAAVFEGLDVLEPGLVDVTDWPADRPEIEPIGMLGAVGVVPGPVRGR